MAQSFSRYTSSMTGGVVFRTMKSLVCLSSASPRPKMRRLGQRPWSAGEWQSEKDMVVIEKHKGLYNFTLYLSAQLQPHV